MDPRCRSLPACLSEDGALNLEKFLLYRREKARERDEELDWILDRCKDLANAEMKADASYRQRSPRSVKASGFIIRDSEGNIVQGSPKQMAWYIRYVGNPAKNDTKFLKKFRRRFRLPFDKFQEIVDKVKHSDLFLRWCSTDATGRESSPIELLLLGAFRYLGRGWTFDDLEEQTGISEETHRQFFHVFIEWGSTTLYKEYVVIPSTTTAAEDCMHEMNVAGFHGCIGSSDATHVGLEKCSWRLTNLHDGHKLNMPSRTYNITVNHRRLILSSMKGHPARYNDKTVVWFDDLLVGIKQGDLLSDVVFYLFERDAMSEDGVKKVEYKGVWVMVDNGYLRWSTTMPPFKSAIDRAERRWSEWLESMRKDVECTFGILKGRFRILKTGIRLHGVEAADKIRLTCCALHNMLLIADGLNERWEEGVDSDWQGELGQHDPDEVCDHVPFAINRLNNLDSGARRYDTSGMGHGSDFIDVPDDDDDADEEQEEVVDDDGAILVRTMNYDKFRSKLVEHFDILFEQQRIRWPRRNRPQQQTMAGRFLI